MINQLLQNCSILIVKIIHYCCAQIYNKGKQLKILLTYSQLFLLLSPKYFLNKITTHNQYKQEFCQNIILEGQMQSPVQYLQTFIVILAFFPSASPFILFILDYLLSKLILVNYFFFQLTSSLMKLEVFSNVYVEA